MGSILGETGKFSTIIPPKYTKYYHISPQNIYDTLQRNLFGATTPRSEFAQIKHASTPQGVVSCNKTSKPYPSSAHHCACEDAHCWCVAVYCTNFSSVLLDLCRLSRHGGKNKTVVQFWKVESVRARVRTRARVCVCVLTRWR